MATRSKEDHNYRSGCINCLSWINYLAQLAASLQLMNITIQYCNYPPRLDQQPHLGQKCFSMLLTAAALNTAATVHMEFELKFQTIPSFMRFCLNILANCSNSSRSVDSSGGKSNLGGCSKSYDFILIKSNITVVTKSTHQSRSILMIKSWWHCQLSLCWCRPVTKPGNI